MTGHRTLHYQQIWTLEAFFFFTKSNSVEKRRKIEQLWPRIIVKNKLKSKQNLYFTTHFTPSTGK